VVAIGSIEISIRVFTASWAGEPSRSGPSSCAAWACGGYAVWSSWSATAMRASRRPRQDTGGYLQRCRVHFMRNALAHAGKTQRRMNVAGIFPNDASMSGPWLRSSDWRKACCACIQVPARERTARKAGIAAHEGVAQTSCLLIRLRRSRLSVRVHRLHRVYRPFCRSSSASVIARYARIKTPTD